VFFEHSLYEFVHLTFIFVTPRPFARKLHEREGYCCIAAGTQ